MTAFWVALPFAELRFSSLSGASHATVTALSVLMPASSPSVSPSPDVPLHAENSSAPVTVTASAALVRLIFNVPPPRDGGRGRRGVVRPPAAPSPRGRIVSARVDGHAHHGLSPRYRPSCEGSPPCPVAEVDRYRVDTGRYGHVSAPRRPGNTGETSARGTPSRPPRLTMRRAQGCDLGLRR